MLRNLLVAQLASCPILPASPWRDLSLSRIRVKANEEGFAKKAGNELTDKADRLLASLHLIQYIPISLPVYLSTY